MSTQGAFVVPIHDLDVMGREVKLPISPSWLRGALEGCEMQPLGSDGLVDVRISKTGNDVLVRGKVAVELSIACARCLAPVILRPDIDLSLLLTPAVVSAAVPARRSPVGGASGRKKDAAVEEDATFNAEEADEDTYEGDHVVLDRFVREAILLEAPIFPLCSDACEGIRPAPDSTSRPEAEPDPRFLPLLELAKKRKLKE